MKQLLILSTILFSLTSVAQSLKPQAEHIKANYPVEYKNTIRKHAVEEWGDDHRMVVYEINTQSEALFWLVENFESDNTSIFTKALVEWSEEGYEYSNGTLLLSLERVDYKSLLQFHCDWRMVKYEYENQTKAKSSY